jgi:flavodoxin
MKNPIFLWMIIALCFTSACSKAQSTLSKNVLIVYLSRTNNTKAIAEIIHKNVGGKLVALELEKPYQENYQAIVQQVVNENETGFLPPIKSFLKQYDLSGKTVIPFNTNAGYGIGTSFETVKKLCKNSQVLEGFTMKGGIERDGVYFDIKDEKAKEAENKVKQWLRNIKLIK